MTYQEQMDRLWDIINNHRHKFKETNLGLTKVDFDTPLKEFTEKYLIETQRNNVKNAKVATSIDDAIKILTQKENEIAFHHLSCATKAIYGKNTALCIHYTNKKNNQISAVVLPGISYIPTKETMEKIQKLESVQDY